VRAIDIAAGIDCHEALEAGYVLVFPDVPLGLTVEDRALLRNIRPGGVHHKNIAYNPRNHSLSGLSKTSAATRERIREILRRYSEAAVGFAANVLPRYREGWRVDYASLRPVEEAGRNLPFKKRNDLLHTDAFPTRPTRGGLILRIFYNFHSSRPRIWLVSDPFESLARRYAAEAGLPGVVQRRHFFRGLLQRLRLPVPARTAYDEFMLAFHDYLKGNAEFQSSCPKYRLEFQPRCAWMAFTDVVPHAVEAGQFAIDQTLIVPRDSLAWPERAPISVLEKMAGRRLA
jgi:3-deoxy-D-manno-oct-2-ulosonic acid (Kdo) hydroxylase